MRGTCLDLLISLKNSLSSSFSPRPKRSDTLKGVFHDWPNQQRQVQNSKAYSKLLSSKPPQYNPPNTIK